MITQGRFIRAILRRVSRARQGGFTAKARRSRGGKRRKIEEDFGGEIGGDFDDERVGSEDFSSSSPRSPRLRGEFSASNRAPKKCRATQKTVDSYFLNH